MSCIGNGYSVGPETEVSGEMVLDVLKKLNGFHFIIRENKEFTLESKGRRRENAVLITKEQAQKVADYITEVNKVIK